MLQDYPAFFRSGIFKKFGKPLPAVDQFSGLFFFSRVAPAVLAVRPVQTEVGFVPLPTGSTRPQPPPGRLAPFALRTPRRLLISA